MAEYSLRDLYHIMSTSKDNTEIQQATNMVEEMYKQPEVFDAFLECMADPSESIKKYAAVGFRLMVVRSWSIIEDAGLSEQYREGIVKIIKNLSYYCVENMAEGLDEIFQKYGEEWEEMVSAIFEMFADPQKVCGAFLLLKRLLPYSKTEFITEIAPNVYEFIVKALQQNNETLDVLAAELLNQLITRDEIPIDVHSEEFQSTFDAVFEKYCTLVATPSEHQTEHKRNLSKMAKNIGQLLTKEVPIKDPAEIYEVILGIFSGENVILDNAVTAFTPLHKLAHRFPSLTSPHFEATIELIYQFIQSSFNEDECFTEMVNDQNKLILRIAEATPHTTFLEVILGMVSDDDIASYATSLSIINTSIEVISDAIEENPQQLVNILIMSLQVENHVIIEGALSAIITLINCAKDVADKYTEEIFEAASPLFEAELDEVGFPLLYEMFNALFTETNISLTIVNSVVENIADVIESQGSVPYPELLSALNGAIVSAGPNSAAFIERIYGILQSVISDDESAENISKAIECIGNLIGVCSEVFGEDIMDAFAFIQNGLENEDLQIKISAINAARNVVKHYPDSIFKTGDPLSVEIFLSNFANSLIDDMYHEYMQKSEGEYQMMITYMDLIIDSFKLISTIIGKSMPTVLENFETFKAFIDISKQHFMSFSVAGEPELVAAVIPLGVKLALLYANHGDEEFPHQVIETILPLFNDEDEENVMTAFKGMDKYIKGNKELVNIEAENEEGEEVQVVPYILDLSLQTIARKTPLFEDEDKEEGFIYNANVIPLACDLIVDIALNYPDQFSEKIDEYVGMLAENMDNFSPIEKCVVMSTASALPEAGIESPEELIQMAFNLLELCDFTHSPDPLFYLAEVLVNQPALVESIAQDFVGILVGKVNEKESKARYYWETVANAGSGLLRIMETEGLSDLVDIGSVFPVIVSHLPYHGDYVESRKILRSVIGIYNNHPEIGHACASQVLNGVISTVILSESEWRQYELEEADVEALRDIISQANQNGTLASALEAVIGDDSAKALLFQNRTGIEL